jgi:NAD(P)-dependent dehydrogenase (short-subunit alcohol dehydrogenase family)
MASQLNGKVAIVTGSSSGLGEAIAVLFASRGARVTLCGRNEERLSLVFEKVVQASAEHHDWFHTVVGDLNDQTIREQVVTETVKKFGQLDILVANAGVASPNGTLSDATEESFDKMMNTNVKSVFFLIQQAVPSLEKSRGVIITTSSMLSSLAASPSIIYPMTKAVIDHLTRCLAVDLGPKGIRVNSVNPSFIPTRIRRLFGGDVSESANSWASVEESKQPLKNRSGTPEDVAETVAFLASDAAGFITGQHVKLDGGRSFGGPYGQPGPSDKI